MAKNPLIRSFPRRVSKPLPNKSAGILDDFAVRKVIATKEGSITRTPVNDIDIANKAYVDSVAGIFDTDIIVVLDGAVATLDGNVLILQ